MGGGRCSSLPQVSMCLNAGAMGRQDAESETLIPTFGGVFDVAHTLRGEGFDASEDGTGRGTPLVPVGFDTAATLDSRANAGGFPGTDGACGGHVVPVAFSSKDYGADAGELSPTLRAMGHDGSHANGGGQVAVAFAHQGGGVQTTLGYDTSHGTAPTLAKCQTPAVHAGMRVRRLTPVECERLQGFPDGYTAIPWRGKPASECPDGPRYKALGNSWAVTCARWIGRRIAAVAAQSEARAAA